MRSWLIGAGAMALWLVLGQAAAFGQNARIVGTIKDQTGGVLPGVTVTATNQATGLVRSEVTDASGEYRLVALPPGSYSLKTELQGFRIETRPAIVLVIDQTATINVTLAPAAVAETVTVTGEAPIVDVTRSDVSTAISTQQIQALPVASRRWIDLAMLTPGTSQDNIRGFYYRGNVNVGAGTREYSNMIYVDGVNNTWAEMGEPRQNFGMDAIQEFKVSTSTYKAEYGLATGGVVNVVTKSGTNNFRGSAFLFFRDKALTAKEYFQASRPPYRRYQDGGALGGPIIKDRTHFFFTYERTDENQFFTVNTRGAWPQYDGTVKSAQNRWTYLGRLDHQITGNQSLFVRWAQENEYRPIVTAGGTTAPSGSFDFAVPRQSAVVGHTWVMSARALNDFRFQYAFSRYEVEAPNSGAAFNAGDFSQARLAGCSTAFRYPTLVVGNCNTQMGPEHRYEFKDDYSYQMPDWGGRHTWKTGVDFSDIPFAEDSTINATGTWTLSADRAPDPNDPSTWPTQYSQSLPSYADMPTKTWAAYVQDDWEPTENLTLNLGVRYDRQIGSFNENLNDMLAAAAAKLGPQFAQYPIPVPFIDTSVRGDRNNFGPRAGFAWSPGTSGLTNVHAAYGMFYDNVRTLTNAGEITWPQARPIVINDPSYPDPLQGKSRDAYISSSVPNITVLDNHSVNPYAHQFNVGVTRELTRDLGVTVDFTSVWRYSDRDNVDINLPDPITHRRPYPQFGRVTNLQSTSNNNYKALLVKLDKHLSHRFSALASYTLSVSKDMPISNNLADVYGYSRETGYSIADRRHRLVLSGIVQLPADVQLSAILDLRSSLPFNPATSIDLNHDGYTGDVPAGVGWRSGCRDLNLDALNAFRQSRGLAPVSSVQCPGYADLDLRFSKTFQIQSQAFELLAQIFNVTNRANFGTPVANPTAAAFGQVNQLLANINAPSRQMEVAVRYRF
ncbi:MAG: TonB-dependent receptor [Betaproteobacteria bacterium]